MKKIILALIYLVVMVSFVGCNHGFGTDLPVTITYTVSDYPAAIMLDDEIYLKGMEVVDIGDSEPDGYTLAYTSEYPKQNGECNFIPEVGAPYIYVGDGIAIHCDSEWYLCTPKIEFVEQEATVVALDYGLMVVSENTGLCFVNTQEITLDDDISVGDTVEISYDGAILESYPSEISNVLGVSVLEQGDDVLGAYRAAFAYLRQCDNGLDQNVQKVALDLNAVSNLTQQEKNAFTYLVSCDFDFFENAYQSTFDELVESGDIVDDGFISFENGVLYTFAQIESSANSFTFNMEKFRSSLGAYGVGDCQVLFDDDGSFELKTGDEWIS